MKHIGIVAVSTEGAALCYRTIVLEGAALRGSHAHPEIPLLISETDSEHFRS
jgi:aspartate racemase